MFKRRWYWLAIIAVMIPLHTARADGDDDDDDDEDEGGLKTALSGFIRADFRYALPRMNPFWCPKSAGRGCVGDRRVSDIRSGFDRNEKTARFRFTVRSGEYKGVAELDFVWTGYMRPVGDLVALSDRSNVDPFRIEAHALYFDVTDFLTQGLDVRIGKQIVTWGKADMFNPTSNINPLDLEDSLLFGDRVSNNMIRVDYNPWKDLIFTLVWVPIFKPFQLNRWAPIAIKGVDRIPIADGSIRRRLHVERDYAEQFLGMPTVVTRAGPVQPETRIENSQVAFKTAWKMAKMDFSASYYYGRHGIPQPYLERTSNGGGFVDAVASLMYPKMHTLGFDWSGQIPLGKLGGGGRGIGFWVEAAVFFPQEVRMPIFQEGLPIIPDGEYDYNGPDEPGVGLPPTIISSRPFAKWTVGLDYTFNRYVFVNVQWVHGFIDEFGAGDFFHKSFVPTRGYTDLDVNNDGIDDLDLSGFGSSPCMNLSAGVGDGNMCAKEYLRPRLGDYLVAGMDFKFYKGQMLLRLFFIFDLTGIYISEWVGDPANPADGRRVRTHKNIFTPDGFSLVVFPSWTWNMGSGVELTAGAFWMLGRRHTKFGDPATGGSVVFAKGKFSF